MDLAKDMEEWKLRRQVAILEAMETISNWITGMDRARNRRDRLVRRHVRSVLKRKYRKYKRLGELNIAGQQGQRVKALRSFKHYESKALKEVVAVFGGSRLYGDGLELVGIFGKYGDVHGCRVYETFLRRVHRVDARGSGFRYLEYLHELSEYLRGFIKVKYPGVYRRRWASMPKVVNRADGQSFCVSKGAEDGGGFPKVYCVKCEREISRSVVRYHLDGRRHKRREGGDEILHCSMSIEGAEDMVREGFRALEKERRYSVSLLSRRRKQAGKDVPKWQHRLKDLDIMFECSICGYSGYGRDGFDEHFGEEGHAREVLKHGIEYGPRLKGITRVDVLMDMKSRQRDSDSYSEEFEDAEGNVFDRRTYEDLVRNGLI